MDCSGGFGRGDTKTLEESHSLALVHFVFLSGGCRKHLPSFVREFLARVKQSGKGGPNRDALFNWNGNLARDFAAGGGTAFIARRNSMDSRRHHIAVANFRRLDFAVTANAHPDDVAVLREIYRR